MDELTRMIKGGLEAFSVPYSPKTLLNLRNYIELLWTWNSVFRLTGESSKSDLITNQLIDSLTLYKFLTQTGLLVDIGSGAGFPGLVVKVIHLNKEVWLVEANVHKANFLRDIQRNLNLDNLVIWEGRAEDLPEEKMLTARCLECTAKGFGKLEKFLEICFPLLSNGGSAFAMVGNVAPVNPQALSIYMEPVTHRITNPFKNRERTILQFSKRR